MKHLLRKLHIGGSVNEQQHRLNSSPARVPLPSSSSSSASSSSSSSTSTFPRTRGIDAVDRITEGGGGGVVHTDTSTSVDYNFFEEEFQVQLALAISASDPEGTEDRRESAQIKAAEQLSLCCSSSTDTTETLAEDIALRYWNYNVVDYHEKIMDGFYDVYGITSDSLMQGRMPLLVDLQATSILDNVGYEVILVNRTVDAALQQLERSVDSLLQECPSELGPILSGLIQKIADLVVASMGGPVGDAAEMSKRWKVKSDELRSSLNAIVLPLGCLNVGLSRHRALLFKVLADRINLPCRLVKGSYYTGTDEGAVNLIKIDYDGEYIIDLMGAPGVLIPAEIPSNHFQNFGVDLRGSLNNAQTVKHSSLAFGKVNHKSDNKIGILEGSLLDSDVAQKDSSESNGASDVDIQSKGNNVNLVPRNQTERFEDDFGKLLPSLRRSPEGTLGSIGKNSPAQKLQVKDVSKCVISAAQNPDFAQKLHALLLESSALPPDLLADLDPSQDLEEHSEQNALVQSYSMNGEKVHVEAGQLDNKSGFGMPGLHFAGGTNVIRQATEADCLQEYKQRSVGSKEILLETINNNPKLVRNAHNEWLNSMLDEVADWEIPWCDIQIGERIGIGSYGEVYHADLNGTEVAVKKFFDQDFSGDALEQLKCEVRIMLRLRHPNVVLFMGAVTRPPNLSILTEFLPRGSLCKLLHRPNVHLDEKRRLRMALDVAKGMNYLHTSNPTIVHRDLKSPNLLVDKNWVVKVCDFGLSRLKHHTFLSSKSMAGTPEWMAPEVLRNEPSNEKCDVYSFGVILWELATLRLPWSGMNPMQVVGAVGFQNRRLEIPEEVDPMVAQIMRDCWHSDPDLRPSFSQLMSLLKRSKHLVVEKT